MVFLQKLMEELVVAISSQSFGETHYRRSYLVCSRTCFVLLLYLKDTDRSRQPVCCADEAESMTAVSSNAGTPSSLMSLDIPAVFSHSSNKGLNFPDTSLAKDT